MSYVFCSKRVENRLRYDKLTESLKVGTFFETQCKKGMMTCCCKHRWDPPSFSQPVP